MARRRRAVEESAPTTALPLPYPSAPTRIATHVVVGKKDDRYCCLTFAARYAARAFADALREGEGSYRYVRASFKDGPWQAHFDSGLIIQCDPASALEDLIEGPALTELELEFRQDPVYGKQIDVIKHGRSAHVVEQEDGKIAEPKREKIPSTRLPKTGKGPNDFAKELNVDPGKVRQALRKLMTKPANGWDFDDKSYADILPKVRAALK